MAAKEIRALLSRHRVATVTLATVLILLISGTVYAQTPGGRDTLQLMLHGSLNTKDTSIDSEDTGLPETIVMTSSPVEAETGTTGLTDATDNTTPSTGEATTTATTTKATTAATTKATTSATTEETFEVIPTESVTFYPDMAGQVLALVNEQRALEINGSLPPLSSSTSLTNAANIRAQETVVLWDHVRPDKYRSSFSTAVSGSWSKLGENIAMGYASAESVVAGWMGSEGHKKNILNASYTHMGISCCKDSDGYYYWAQEFGG
jgi:uncharacterized protein YkwD